MAIEASLARLRKVALALPRPDCPWEEQPRFGPPATAQSVIEFESVVGFALPADFRDFLRVTDAVIGMSVHNGYWLGGMEQLIEMASGDHLPRIVDSEPVAPVATDGGGNTFLLAQDSRVWRWDHETSEVTQVATSFGAFLERVAEDWEAFVADTPGWRYLV